MTPLSSPNIPFIDSAVVSWFLPAELREAKLAESYRERIVILSSFLLSILGPISALIWLRMEQPGMAQILVAISLGCVAVLPALRVSGTQSAVGHYLCLMALILLCF